MDDGGFGVEEVAPAVVDLADVGELAGKLQEAEVVALFGGPEAAVEAGEFGVGAGGGEEEEAFAGAGLDEGGDEEAVDDFAGAALADEGVEGAGVGVGVGLGEAAAAA